MAYTGSPIHFGQSIFKADLKKMTDAPTPNRDFTSLTTLVVSSYVASNTVPSGELPRLISEVHSALYGLAFAAKAQAIEAPVPAVPIKKSVTPDYIICLEDGKKFKSLKRHLSSQFNLTPEQYRARWNLPDTYPMVAPNYSEARSAMARSSGLGLKVQIAREEAKAPRKKIGLKFR